MRIAFVGSDPSRAGPDSSAIQNLVKWIESIQLNVGYSFYNVSNLAVPDDRSLKKSESELDRLRRDLRGARRVVALGAAASEALAALGIEHFKLPHPIPSNRALNNKETTDRVLADCKIYLENAYVDIDG